MEKYLKCLYTIITAIICFTLFSNEVHAVVTCDAVKKNDYFISFHVYDTSDTEHDGSYVNFRLDSTTKKIETLYVCGESIIRDGNNVSKYDLSSKRSFNCSVEGSGSYTVYFGNINLAGKFYTVTNNATCGIAYPSTVNITGLNNAPEEATSDSVMCSGAGYNFVVREGQDNQTQCNVIIKQDSADSDVVMKHGSQTTTNPRTGKYVCETPEGDKVEFYLSKTLSKGSLKSASDCPKLTKVSGSDGTQAEIENPVVGPKPGADDPEEEPTTGQDTTSSTTPVVTPNIGNETCTSLLGNPSDQGAPAYYLTQAFKIMRYVAIVLLAVLSVMDFIEATASQDSDAISKAVNKTIKRLVLCVIIFLLPSLIEFILTLLSERAASICIDH